MSFGTTLTSYRDAKGGNKQVAPILHERWPHPEDRPEISTIGSRLSELVAEKARGVKFFFDDLAIAALLLDVLDVKDGDRDALRDEAAALAAGTPSPKLIVEASALGADDRDTADRLFPLIEAQIPSVLAPVAVVVREAQYKWLPRSIEPPRFVIHRVIDEAAGSAKVAELAERRGLVWSPRRGTVPVERWAAVQFSDGKLSTYPPDALEAYAVRGVLAAPMQEFRSLQSQGVAPEPVTVPTDPLLLRKLFDDLQNPAAAGKLRTPSLRVGLSNALGIAAAATERECVEFDIAATIGEIGLPCALSTQGSLASLLDRATRRDVPPTVLRIGDDLHAINVPHSPERQNLTAHRVAPRPAMITRLYDMVAGRTRDDWRDDRFLERGFEPEREELAAYRIARATILHTGVEVRDAPADPDGVVALAMLVVGRPPAARLAVTSERAADRMRVVLTRRELDRLGERQSEGTEGLWRVPPCIDECLADRADGLFLLDVPLGKASAEHPLVPVGSAALQDANGWLDALDAEQVAMTKSAERHPHLLAPPRQLHRDAYLKEHRSGLLGAGAWARASPKPLRIDDATWREADHHLALCLCSLRLALNAPEVIPLHDGSVLLALGHGVFAAVHARKHGATDRPVGIWLRGAYRHGESVEPILAPAATYFAASPGGSSLYPVGPILPRGLLLTGKGWAIDVSFVGSALLSGEPANVATLAASAGAIADSE
jgi:hypothetical protein